MHPGTFTFTPRIPGPAIRSGELASSTQRCPMQDALTTSFKQVFSDKMGLPLSGLVWQRPPLSSLLNYIKSLLKLSAPAWPSLQKPPAGSALSTARWQSGKTPKAPSSRRSHRPLPIQRGRQFPCPQPAPNTPISQS